MIHTARQSPKFKLFVRHIRKVAQNPVVDVESIAISILERLWHQTAIGARNGDIGKFDDELIAEECGWLGDADFLIEALVNSGYVDNCEVHRLVVHDWRDHAPNHVKGVVERSIKNGGDGWATKVSNPELATQSSEPRSATQGSQPPNLTKPNLTKPNQSKEANASGSEQTSPPEFEFTLSGGKLFGLPSEKLQKYKTTYERVDVPAELRKAGLWLDENAQRRPRDGTGMLRFLTRWMNRADESYRRTAPPRASPAAATQKQPSAAELDALVEGRT